LGSTWDEGKGKMQLFGVSLLHIVLFVNWCLSDEIICRSTEPDRVVWEKGHQLFRQAFKEPKTQLEKKRLAKLVKKALPADVDHALFDYEQGFLKMLGKMNLSALSFLF